MSRVVVIEQLTDGCVVRCLGDAGNGAVAYSGDKALKHALAHAKAYMLAPVEDSPGAVSFPFMAMMEPTGGALERKSDESDRLAPTASTFVPPNPHKTTELQRPRWRGPVSPA